MIFALSLALALSAASADSAATDAKANTEAPAEKPKKERKICRIPETSGTRLAAKVCKTREEWEAVSQRDGMDTRTSVSK